MLLFINTKEWHATIHGQIAKEDKISSKSKKHADQMLLCERVQVMTLDRHPRHQKNYSINKENNRNSFIFREISSTSIINILPSVVWEINKFLLTLVLINWMTMLKFLSRCCVDDVEKVRRRRLIWLSNFDVWFPFHFNHPLLFSTRNSSEVTPMKLFMPNFHRN